MSTEKDILDVLVTAGYENYPKQGTVDQSKNNLSMNICIALFSEGLSIAEIENLRKRDVFDGMIAINPRDNDINSYSSSRLTEITKNTDKLLHNYMKRFHINEKLALPVFMFTEEDRLRYLRGRAIHMLEIGASMDDLTLQLGTASMNDLLGDAMFIPNNADTKDC